MHSLHITDINPFSDMQLANSLLSLLNSILMFKHLKCSWSFLSPPPLLVLKEVTASSMSSIVVRQYLGL